jgi:hypothetical protein
VYIENVLLAGCTQDIDRDNLPTVDTLPGTNGWSKCSYLSTVDTLPGTKGWLKCNYLSIMNTLPGTNGWSKCTTCLQWTPCPTQMAGWNVATCPQWTQYSLVKSSLHQHSTHYTYTGNTIGPLNSNFLYNKLYSRVSTETGHGIVHTFTFKIFILHIHTVHRPVLLTLSLPHVQYTD